VATADNEVKAMTEKYNPYLTIRRNIQHADEDFVNVMWLHKVHTILCFFSQFLTSLYLWSGMPILTCVW